MFLTLKDISIAGRLQSLCSKLCKQTFIVLLISLSMQISCGKVAQVIESGALSADPGPLKFTSSELGIVSLEVPYKEAILVEGGQAPYTYKLLKGKLIEGLVLNEKTGIISGQVSKAKKGAIESITLTVTDAANITVEQNFTLNAATYEITIAPDNIPEVIPTIPYALQFNAVGAVEPVKFSLAGTLPRNLTFSESGALQTEPSGLESSDNNSEWPVELSVQDANGTSATLSYILKVGQAPNNALLSIHNDSLTAMQVGNYSSGIITTGGIAPLSYTLEGGSLPTGLTLDSGTGVIAGTIPSSASGSAYAVVVKVADASGQAATKTYSGTVAAGSSELKIHTDALSQITAGISFSYKLAVTGGKTPYNFGVASGGLPTGMSINSVSGLISGTPTSPTGGQAYAFTIACTDADGQITSKTYIGTVAASSSSTLSIVTATITTPTAGSSYLAAIGVTGGTMPYTFMVLSGALPSGLALNTNSGLLSGTVAHSARGSSYLFSIAVTDSTGLTTSQSYSGFVGNYSISIVPGALAAANPGADYTASLATVGGEAPYSFTLTSGTLPSGLSMNGTTGIITGKVSEAEAGLTKNFAVKSTDANNAQVTTNYSLAINSFAVNMLTTSLNDAVENQLYSNASTSLTATGGTPPYTYEYSGTLPSGVGLTSAGSFFGIPSVGSGSLVTGTSYTIYVRARDSAGNISAQKTLSFNVTIDAPAIAAGDPASATLGATYSQSLTATGGRSPYTFSLVSGSLPTGLTLSSNGALTGTATASASCPANNFVVKVVDNLGQNSSNSTKCISTVNGITLTNSSFPTVVVGVNYNATVGSSGGTGSVTYSATGLPSGISLNASTGALSGFVNAATGNYTSYISAADSSSPVQSTTRAFSFKVRNPLAVTATTLAKAGTETSYGPITIGASGGESPYNFTISSGSLPSGLSMNSSGEISGSPAASSAATNSGVYSFSIVATDVNGLTSAAQSFTINVSVAPKIITASLPVAVVGTPYAFDLVRQGGYNPFISAGNISSQLTWNISGLPAGLSASSAGRISGTPTSAAGSPFAVSVTLTDGNGISSSKSLSLTVSATGKTLDLDTGRAVEPCPQATTYNCDPRGYRIATLVPSQATTKYIAYSANISPGTVAAPVPRIYIARMDSSGRFPTPGASSLSVTYTPPSTPFITSIDIADVDNDGYQDIIYADQFNNRITVVWNSGTTDVNGMPVFTTENNFSMPAGGSAGNRPYTVKAVALRPDATNSNKKDLIVSDWNFNSPTTAYGRIVVYLASTACAADCSGSRSTVYTAAGASITAYGTLLAASPANGLVYMNNIEIGYFNTAPGAGVCPSIVVTGKQDNATNDWIYLRHQTFGGGVCSGTFSTHASTDEKQIATGSNLPGGISTADLNGDNISDIAVTLRTALANSASVKIYLMPGANAFPLNPLNPYLPNTTGVTYGAAKVIPYCLNGAASCSYPSLLVVGNRDTSIAPTGGSGFISILPNQGIAPFFDDNSGATRIDYTAPNGIADIILSMPIVSSGLNDIAFMGYEVNGYPFYFLLPRNGSSTTRPFKQNPMLRAFPDVFAAFAEAGPIKLADMDHDGVMDIFTHLVNQSAVSLHVGQTGATSAASLPSSVYNVMGVAHGYPYTWHMQNTMDVADFNNDGYPDVVVTGYSGRGISVALGSGTSSLDSGVLYELGTSGDLRPQAITTGDYDQDGIIDIVVANNNGTTTTSSFSFLRGKGDGTFYAAAEFLTASGIGCADVRSLDSKDLDGDGRPEIAALCYTSQAVWIIRRHTNGSWVRNSGVTVNAGGGANGTVLKFGRLTSVSGTDLVVGGLDVANSMRIIYGLTLGTPDGSGNFSVSANLSSYIRLNGYLSDVDTGDLNADGYGDIVASIQSQNSTTTQAGQILYTCKSTSAGNCTLEGWSLEQPNATGVALGDLNSDGLLDIVQGGKVGQRLYYRTISRYLNSSY